MSNNLFFKFLVVIISSIHFLFPKILDHNPSNVVNYNESFDIQMFTDYPSSDIIKAELYIKTDNEIAYLKIDIDKTSDNYYQTTIPAEFIIGDYIEYYILVELANGDYKTIPENEPHINPFSIKVVNREGIKNTQDLLKADFEIIAPKQNQKLQNDDVIISLSYLIVNAYTYSPCVWCAFNFVYRIFLNDYI